MKARHIWSTIVILSLSTTAILFNNCSGHKAESEPSDTAQASTGGSSNGTFSGKLSANFQYVSTDGRAWGYAQDSINKIMILKVLFYANGSCRLISSGVIFEGVRKD